MAAVTYWYSTVVQVYSFIRLTLQRIYLRCLCVRFITFDSASVFEETPQLIGNYNHLHFGHSFVAEFAGFPVFKVSCKE